MNPYREPGKPTSRLREFFVNRVRRITPLTAVLAAVLIAGIALAATPALRVNGLQFGAQDNSKNAIAFGVTGNGTTDDSAALNSALAGTSGPAVVNLPSTSASYKIGTTTINMVSGVVLNCVSRNGCTLIYTGTGCAVKFDSTDSAGLNNIYIQVNSSSATARGICFANTSGDNKFNRLENVKIIQTNTPTTPVSGQVGVDFSYTGSSNAMYWNRFDQVELGGWDKAIRMLGSVGLANG